MVIHQCPNHQERIVPIVAIGTVIETVIVVITDVTAIVVIGIAAVEEEMIVEENVVLNVKHQAIVLNQAEDPAKTDVTEKVVDVSPPCIGMYLLQDLNT